MVFKSILGAMCACLVFVSNAAFASIVHLGSSATANINVYDTTDWSPVSQTNLGIGSIQAIAFGADGFAYLGSSATANISVYDPTDWSLVSQTNLGIGAISAAAFGADGFAYLGSSATANINVYDPTDWSLVSQTNLGIGAISAAAFASPVPIPAAVWLFGSGLLGLIGVARRKKA